MYTHPSSEPSRTWKVQSRESRLARFQAKRPDRRRTLEGSTPVWRRLSKRARRDMAGHQPHPYTGERLGGAPNHQSLSVNHPLDCSGSPQLQADSRTIAVLRDELDAGRLQGCTDRRKRAMVRRPVSKSASVATATSAAFASSSRFMRSIARAPRHFSAVISNVGFHH